MTQAQRIFDGSVNYCHRSYEALEGADALLICTEWDEFRSPEFQRIKKILKNPVIFGGAMRNNKYSRSEFSIEHERSCL